MDKSLVIKISQSATKVPTVCWSVCSVPQIRLTRAEAYQDWHARGDIGSLNAGILMTRVT